MFHQKSIPLLAIGSILFYLSGCSSKNKSIPINGYSHSGIYFGKNFSVDYQQGIADGCSTSKGKYTKSHMLFNNSRDYNNGWFLGRNRCLHLLDIEDEKK